MDWSRSALYIGILTAAVVVLWRLNLPARWRYAQSYAPVAALAVGVLAAGVHAGFVSLTDHLGPLWAALQRAADTLPLPLHTRAGYPVLSNLATAVVFLAIKAVGNALLIAGIGTAALIRRVTMRLTGGTRGAEIRRPALCRLAYGYVFRPDVGMRVRDTWVFAGVLALTLGGAALTVYVLGVLLDQPNPLAQQLVAFWPPLPVVPALVLLELGWYLRGPGSHTSKARQRAGESIMTKSPVSCAGAWQRLEALWPDRILLRGDLPGRTAADSQRSSPISPPEDPFLARAWAAAESRIEGATQAHFEVFQALWQDGDVLVRNARYERSELGGLIFLFIERVLVRGGACWYSSVPQGAAIPSVPKRSSHGWRGSAAVSCVVRTPGDSGR